MKNKKLYKVVAYNDNYDIEVFYTTDNCLFKGLRIKIDSIYFMIHSVNFIQFI